MPYKDPERKRQWEREHREERNAMRRAQRIAAENRPPLPKPTPDPIAPQKPTSGWKALLGIACAVGLRIITIIAGTPIPPATDLGSPGGSGN